MEGAAGRAAEVAAPVDLLAAAVVLLFAGVHVYGGRLRFLNRTPRSIWLSMGGGVSAAYVFLHLLPELRRGQQMVLEQMGEGGWLQHHVYLLALAGLTLFYGLERLVCRSRGTGTLDEHRPTPAGVFSLHIGSFALYNFIIGLLLVQRERTSATELVLYAIALSLHFLVNDHGLRHHHRARYHRIGRWLLAAAVIGGWVLGLLVAVPVLWLQLGIALLAGGIVMNVMKEELPGERESRFSAFVFGAAGYAALLVALG